MAWTLGDIAETLGLTLHGPATCEVHDVAGLEQAGPGTIAFLANPRFRRHLAHTRASAVILSPADVAHCPVASLVSDNPHLTYAKVAALLKPEPVPAPGVHPSATVTEGSQVDPTAHVGPQAFIEAGARIGAGAIIGPQCVIGSEVEISADVRLVGSVTVIGRVRIGPRTVVQPGAVIGGEGFGFAREGDCWIKVPQLGGVRIGADVEIGANTTIDRGALDDTVIEDGVKLDNQIQVGHNAHIGRDTIVAACTGISGSTNIGRACMIGGGVGFAGHMDIADNVQITARTRVSKSIREPGSYSSGWPMQTTDAWRRSSVRVRQLDELARRIAALEKAAKNDAGDGGESGV